MPRKPFIHYDDLTTWDEVVILFFSIFTVVAFCVYGWGSTQSIQKAIIFYGTSFQMLSILLLYKALCNFRFYIIWMSFALLQLIVYVVIKEHDALTMDIGNAASVLRNSIIVLLLFQMLRFLSLKVQKREFIVPWRPGKKDFFDIRVPTGTDYLITLAYWILWGTLLIVSVKN